MAQILDALRRDGDSSNTIIGIVILVLLTVFVAPDILPQLVADTIPFLEEGLPCESLLVADDRAYHQSLIGNRTNNPLTILVEPREYPTNGTAPFRIRVILINNTIGTVPIVINEEQVIASNAISSTGIGLIFNPPVTPTILGNDNIANTSIGTLQTYPADDIKLLGPRQRCVHVVQIRPGANGLGVFQQGANYQVRAYYNIPSEGAAVQTNPAATPIYPSQNLRIISSGVIESEAVQFSVPVQVQSNIAPTNTP